MRNRTCARSTVCCGESERRERRASTSGDKASASIATGDEASDRGGLRALVVSDARRAAKVKSAACACVRLEVRIASACSRCIRLLLLHSVMVMLMALEMLIGWALGLVVISVGRGCGLLAGGEGRVGAVGLAGWWKECGACVHALVVIVWKIKTWVGSKCELLVHGELCWSLELSGAVIRYRVMMFDESWSGYVGSLHQRRFENGT